MEFKLPPPIIYTAAILFGLILNYFSPLFLLSDTWRYILGIPFIIIGISMIPFFLIKYKKSKTPFDVQKTANTLITDGPNRFTRNPGYLSLTFISLGIGFTLSNFWILGLTIPVVLIVDLWIIRGEERQLEAIFGDQYLRYKSSVRRWI